jgi:hypothetical protein
MSGCKATRQYLNQILIYKNLPKNNRVFLILIFVTKCPTESLGVTGFVVAQFIPLLSRLWRDKGGDWAFWLDESSNCKKKRP